MFDDDHWIGQRTDEQLQRYRDWLRQVQGKRLVAIELGAGTAVPTVRFECERRPGALIRCNPRDTDAPPGSILLPVGALQALQEVDQIVSRRG